MKTINAADKLTDLLRAGQILIVRGNAFVEWIGDGGIKNGPILVTRTQRIGPFQKDVQVVVSAMNGTVTIDYAVLDINSDSGHIETFDSMLSFVKKGGTTDRHKTMNMIGGRPYYCEDYRLLNPAVSAKPRMLTASFGNSFGLTEKWDAAGANTGITARSEIESTNMFLNAPMRRALVQSSASTYTDIFGFYAYSGATLAAMLANMQAEWFDKWDAAGMVPELVWATGLLENDFIGSTSLAGMQKGVLIFINRVLAKWPGVILHLGAGTHPLTAINSDQKRLNYQVMKEYMLGFDNGKNIFVSPLDAYEDPANPGQPTALGSADGTHSSAYGSTLNARYNFAPTISRISASWTATKPAISSNFCFEGSQNITANAKANGTMPSGSSWAFNAGNFTVTGNANDPFYDITLSAQPGGVQDVGWFVVDSFSFSAKNEIAPYVQFEIISGGQYLRQLTVEPRVTDNGVGSQWRYFMGHTTQDYDRAFQDGDILTFQSPPLQKTAGGTGFTTCTHYIKPRITANGGTCTFRCRRQGILV